MPCLSEFRRQCRRMVSDMLHKHVRGKRLYLPRHFFAVEADEKEVNLSVHFVRCLLKPVEASGAILVALRRRTAQRLEVSTLCGPLREPNLVTRSNDSHRLSEPDLKFLPPLYYCYYHCKGKECVDLKRVNYFKDSFAGIIRPKNLKKLMVEFWEEPEI